MTSELDPTSAIGEPRALLPDESRYCDIDEHHSRLVYRGGMTGFPSGSVRLWLRVEGFAVLVVAVYLYARSEHSWVAFAALFLVPDISFVGYLAGPRVGAVVYNLAHSYVGPLLLALAALMNGQALTWALIWAAHIGFDRALGYGLKYPTSVGETHLGRIGRRQ